MNLQTVTTPGAWSPSLMRMHTHVSPALLVDGQPPVSPRVAGIDGPSLLPVPDRAPALRSPVHAEDAGRAMTSNGGGMTFAGMLRDLGIDSLAPGASADLQYVRAQLEVNYQVLRVVGTADGLRTTRMNFSLKLDLACLQVGAGDGTGSPLVADAGGAGGGDAPEDPLQAFKEFFSPEKTAKRILDFALGFFRESRQFKRWGDTRDSRRDFADFIGKAIDRGFAQARSILGDLPEAIETGVRETREHVASGLDDFVTDGLAPDKPGSDGTYAAHAQVFRWRMSMQGVRVDTATRFPVPEVDVVA